MYTKEETVLEQRSDVLQAAYKYVRAPSVVHRMG